MNLFQQLPRIEGRAPEAESMPFSRWSLRFDKDHNNQPKIVLFSAWSETAPHKMVGEFPVTPNFALALNRYTERILEDFGVLTQDEQQQIAA